MNLVNNIVSYVIKVEKRQSTKAGSYRFLNIIGDYVCRFIRK